MSDQLDLFEPQARPTDPSTSHEAAKVAQKRAPSHRDLAFHALRRAGAAGLNDFELEVATGVAQTSIGCRRHDLVTMGLATKLLDLDGRPITRPSPSGSPSQVWVLIEAL